MNISESERLQRVERAIEAIRNGRMVILVDDEDRENEGDLVMAGELVTADAINFMARFGRGLICLSLSPERCDQLDLPMMVQDNRSGFGTAFTVSIEAAHGITTGISAADRARTVRVAVAPNATAKDLVRPGHIFPLRSQRGGVLVRTGQTEGSVDLARLAGLEPAGVICEIMNEDGTMARRPELEKFSQTHGLELLSVADLIRFRLRNERLVHRQAEVMVTVPDVGEFKAVTYSSDVDDREHLALIKGTPAQDTPVLGRVQQESVLGDVFRVGSDESRWRLGETLRMMEKAGCGVLVYLQKPSPKLANEMRSLMGQKPLPEVEDKGAIGLPKHLREYGIGAQILLDQGVRKIRLISNSPTRIKGIEGYGLEVVERIPLARPKADNPQEKDAQ